MKLFKKIYFNILGFIQTIIIGKARVNMYLNYLLTKIFK